MKAKWEGKMKKVVFIITLLVMVGICNAQGLKHEFCIALSRGLVYSFTYGYAVQSYAECVDLVKIVDDENVRSICLLFCFKGVDEGRKGTLINFDILKDVIYKKCMEDKLLEGEQ